ncbi:hypothetical protein, partial [Sporisorium scitamineum]
LQRHAALSKPREFQELTGTAIITVIIVIHTPANRRPSSLPLLSPRRFNRYHQAPESTHTPGDDIASGLPQRATGHPHSVARIITAKLTLEDANIIMQGNLAP